MMPQLERDSALDQGSTQPLPISVVIPAWNEEREIERCLEGLFRQTHTAFEVIVVDNGSTDATASLAEEWGVRVIEQSQHGIACARQTGFDAARGAIIASTDADSPLSSERVHKSAQPLLLEMFSSSPMGDLEVGISPFPWIEFRSSAGSLL